MCYVQFKKDQYIRQYRARESCYLQAKWANLNFETTYRTISKDPASLHVLYSRVIIKNHHGKNQGDLS